MLRVVLAAFVAITFAGAGSASHSVLGTIASGDPGSAERLGAWTIIGPGGGDTMIGPTISPNDPNLVVEHCDMTGGYITRDGGLSWRMFNFRTVKHRGLTPIF